MSKKELYRGEIISNAIKGEITQIKASEQMGISLRQTKRLCKRYRKGGLANLAHRNRGKPSNKKMNSNIRTGMLELIKSNYPDFGPQLIKEQLEERKISKSLEVQYKHKTYQLISKGNGRRLAGKTAMVAEHVDGIRIEFDGEEYDYTIFGDQSYCERVMDRKKLDAFLDRKKPLPIIQRHRMGIVVNF